MTLQTACPKQAERIETGWCSLLCCLIKGIYKACMRKSGRLFVRGGLDRRKASLSLSHTHTYEHGQPGPTLLEMLLIRRALIGIRSLSKTRLNLNALHWTILKRPCS